MNISCLVIYTDGDKLHETYVGIKQIMELLDETALIIECKKKTIITCNRKIIKKNLIIPY